VSRTPDPAPGGRTADRAQLMLATALVLATLFVALALVMNAVIFTENVATQADASGRVHEALGYRNVANEALTRAIADADAGGTTPATVRSAFRAEVANWSDLAASQAAVNGHDLTLTVASMTDGTRLVQANASRPLTNASGAADWTLVDGAAGVRSFALTLTASSLAAAPGDANVTTLRAAGAFEVGLTNSSGATWRVFVYRDSTVSNVVVVRVLNADGSLAPACNATATNGTVTVGVSNASVEGAPCAALGFAARNTVQAVAFRSGYAARGTYALEAARVETAVDDGDVVHLGGPSVPASRPTLYAATVSLEYAGPKVGYRTTLAVVPEAVHG